MKHLKHLEQKERGTGGLAILDFRLAKTEHLEPGTKTNIFTPHSPEGEVRSEENNDSRY